jgi:exopolysaccharide biosynthesis polyprenyl glycosylphosphotransferase
VSTELLPAPERSQEHAVEQADRRHGRGWLVRRALVVADLAGLFVAFVATQTAFGAGFGAENTLGRGAELLVFTATLPAWILLAKLYRLYDRDEERTDHSTSDDVSGVFHLVTVCTWLFLVLQAITGVTRADLVRMVVFWATAIVLVVVARTFGRALARRTSAYVQNAVIVGTDDVAQLIGRRLLRHPEYGINLLGFIGREACERREGLERVAVLGPLERLPGLIDPLRVERVIVGFHDGALEKLVPLVRSLRQRNVQIDLVPRLFEVVGPNLDTHAIEGIQLIGLHPGRLGRSDRVLKRATDLIAGSIAIIVTAPLIAFIAWRIKRDSPGPVFFRQTRLGMNMRQFQVLKFRTMRMDTSEAEHRSYVEALMDPWATPQTDGLYKLERADAVTPVGRWLRRTSLDELPQLVNVLRGEMSLVGPRPCIPYETKCFAQHHFDRFLVPAGITGLWQVKARAHSTFREALDLDVAYAHGWSLGLDLRLLLQTPLQLLRPKHTR